MIRYNVDSDTGLISKNPSVILDRERNPEFELIIEAEDGGEPNALASNTTVFIEVQVTNKNINGVVEILMPHFFDRIKMMNSLYLIRTFIM